MSTRMPALVAAAYAAPFLVFLGVYVPTAGHGFISDDFGWILHNRIRALSDFARIALNDNGFYRPAVAFSFAFNELLFGLNARAYGLTNVALAGACGAAIYLLCRALALPRGAAAFGSALWLLNLHGVNIAILWISGRTALMATAASAGCAAALLSGRHAAAATLLALAVMSREDAALLPLVTLAWIHVMRRHGLTTPRQAWKWGLVSVAIVAGYFAVRSTTNAMTPGTAPSYYTFAANADRLLRNATEYADRTATLPLATLVLLAIVLRPDARSLDSRARAVMMCGLIWLGVFLMPALLLPVRSSLYACMPSVGVCIAASAAAARWWTLADSTRRQRALACAVVVPFLIWPVYQARTDRWVSMAEFSTRALTDLHLTLRAFPDDTDILILDDRVPRANMASVFSTLLRDAFLVTTDRFMTFYVDPPIPNAGLNSGGAGGCNGCEDVRLVVKDGRLVGAEGAQRAIGRSAGSSARSEGARSAPSRVE